MLLPPPEWGRAGERVLGLTKGAKKKQLPPPEWGRAGERVLDSAKGALINKHRKTR